MTERMDRHDKSQSAGMRMEKKPKKKERFVWQDHCKGLAILLVVLGHLLDHDHVYRGETIVSYLIYGFHMPLFFMLSGYTLYLTKPDGTMVDFADYFTSKVKKILLPGVLFTIVEFLYTCVHDYCTRGAKGLVIYLNQFRDLRLLRHTILMDSKSIIPQYWFFPALFTALIGLWLITKCAREIAAAFDKHAQEVENGIKLLFMLLLVLLNSVLKGEHVALPFAIREASLAVVYIWFGMLLREIHIGDNARVKRSAMLLGFAAIYLVSAFIWYASGYKIIDFYNSGIENLPFSYVVGFSGSMAAIMLYRVIDGNRKEAGMVSPLAYAGRNSIWIYGLHFFFLDIWYWINDELPDFRSRYSIIIKLIVAVVIMGLSLLAGRGIEILGMQMKIARRRLRRMRRSNNV